MKLELKEISQTNNQENNLMSHFKTFEDILNCFERQKNSFEIIEKDLLISPLFQVIYIFSFFIFLHPLFTLTSLSIKFSIAYFFQKFIKKMQLNFSFSAFITATLAFANTKLKMNNHKIHLYQNEKRKFLQEFFSFPINKQLIFDYLHTFYQNNEYRLSSQVYSEIDTIKIAIENENYESAFDGIINFKKRINYIKQLDNYTY